METENYVSYFLYFSDLKTIYSYFITIILIIMHVTKEVLFKNLNRTSLMLLFTEMLVRFLNNLKAEKQRPELLKCGINYGQRKCIKKVALGLTVAFRFLNRSFNEYIVELVVSRLENLSTSNHHLDENIEKLNFI